eukprot:7455588-Heterocapsa_arctica.AAC.1
MQRSRPWARYQHGVWFQAYRGKTGSGEAFKWYAPSASLTGVDAATFLWDSWHRRAGREGGGTFLVCDEDTGHAVSLATANA